MPLFASNLHTLHRSNRQPHNGCDRRGRRRAASSLPSNVSEGAGHAIFATDDCSTKQNQNDSPLLRLPPELRNQIYAYVSNHSTAESWYYDEECQFKIRYKHDISGLALACHQLLYDTSPYINSYQHITWHGPIDILRESSWSNSMDMAQIKSIVVSAIRQRCPLSGYDLLFLGHAIPLWPSLRYIEIQRDHTEFCEREALELLRRRMPWKELTVCIKLEEGKSTWTFDCRDRQLTTSGQPYRMMSIYALRRRGPLYAQRRRGAWYR